MPSEPITFFNRHTGQIETEVVYGEGFLRFVYENPLGKAALHTLVKRAVFSNWYSFAMLLTANIKPKASTSTNSMSGITALKINLL